MKAKVKQNQNILDLAVQHGGDISTAFELARKNNVEVDQWVQPGSQIETTDATNEEVKAVFSKSNSPASSTIAPGEVITPDPPSFEFGATITLNGDPFIVAPNNETTNVELVDDNDDPIVPLSVVGNVVKVGVPSGGGELSSFPLVSGQSASFVTGDDGDTQIGANFFEYPIVDLEQKLNYFGNKWRFTGVTGGYYDRDTSQFKDVDGVVTTKVLAFPDYLVIDWYTRDYKGDFVLYNPTSSGLGIPNMTWTSACSSAPASVGSYSGDWKLAQINLLNRLQFQGMMQYEPFGAGYGSVYIMSSSSAYGYANLSASYYHQSNLWYGVCDIRDKTTTAQSNIFAMYIRITNVTEL